MSKKAKIQVSVVSWSAYDLDGKLEDAVLKLQNLITSNPNYFDFTFDFDTESGYYGSCSTNVNVTAFRWETDEELSTRLELTKIRGEAEKIREKQRLAAQEKREKSLYESLKRKFEKEINETTPSQQIQKKHE